MWHICTYIRAQTDCYNARCRTIAKVIEKLMTLTKFDLKLAVWLTEQFVTAGFYFTYINQ